MTEGLHFHFSLEWSSGFPCFLQFKSEYGNKKDFPDGSDGNASVYIAGDLGSIPGSGSSPGEGNDNPLQYSCLENPMNGGTW